MVRCVTGHKVPGLDTRHPGWSADGQVCDWTQGTWGGVLMVRCVTGHKVPGVEC